MRVFSSASNAANFLVETGFLTPRESFGRLMVGINGRTRSRGSSTRRGFRAWTCFLFLGSKGPAVAPDPNPIDPEGCTKTAGYVMSIMSLPRIATPRSLLISNLALMVARTFFPRIFSTRVASNGPNCRTWADRVVDLGQGVVPKCRS